MKKIALCFLTYENLSQPFLWNKIINNNKDKLNIYIHNKNKFIDNKYNFHEYCIKNTVKTEHGKKSLVEATLLLFREAFLNTENMFFILLSDKCIPIHNFQYIYDKIMSINSNIIYTFKNNCTGRYTMINDKNFIKEKDFLKEHQWLLLDRKTTSFFINNDFLNMYNDNSFAVDEHYFGNICNKFKIPYKNQLITYSNWEQKSDNKSDRKFPKTYQTLTNKIVKNLVQVDKYFFMRKISPLCTLPDYFDNIT
jgi:hypothetical protein